MLKYKEFKSFLELQEGIKIQNNEVVFTDDGQTTSFGKTKKLTPYIMKVNDVSDNEYKIFSVYKRSTKSDEFVELVKAIKKNSSVNIDKTVYENFIKRTAIYLTSSVSDITKNIDMILMPPTSSYILSDIVNYISERKPHIKIIKDSFVKNNPKEIKIKDDPRITDAIRSELIGILNRAERDGVFEIKKVRKQNRKFLYNTMITNMSKIKESYIANNNILILDDLLTSGFTIKQMMGALELYNPNIIVGATIFKM